MPIEPSRRARLPWQVALAAFLAIAAFFLWTEHRAHLFGALPYLLVLLCPLMHIFGHGHGGHRGHGRDGPKDAAGGTPPDGGSRHA